MLRHTHHACLRWSALALVSAALPVFAAAADEAEGIGPLRAAPLGPMPDGSTLAANMGITGELPPAPVRIAFLPVADGVPGAAAMAAAEAEADEPAPADGGAAAGTTALLADDIVDALKHNPEIQIALAQQDDARFGVREARAGYLPHVDVSVGWGREFAKAGSAAGTQRYRSEASVMLNQNVWDFGTTINDIKRARASYRSAQWGTREKIEAISYDIASAYLGVLVQQKLVTLTEAEIAATRKIVRIVTVQKDLGLTTPADVERAQARLQNLQSAVLDRKSALEQSRNSYKRLTDHFPGAVTDLPPAIGSLPDSADAAVDLMAAHSPRLAQAVEDRRSLDKQFDSQTGAFFPRVGLQVQGNYKNDVMGKTGRADDARAMVTVSYRLFNGGADAAIRNRIGARLRQADFELDRRRREVEQDLRIDYQALSAAREKIASIDGEIASAERVAELYRQQFREGRRTVFDLLDSQQILYAARTSQLVNQIAMQAAEYRVLQKLGGLFELVSGGHPLAALAQAQGRD